MSPDSEKTQLQREIAESLQPRSEMFPFSGTFGGDSFRSALSGGGGSGAVLLDGMFYRPQQAQSGLVVLENGFRS